MYGWERIPQYSSLLSYSISHLQQRYEHLATLGCVSFFCAVRLLEHTRGKGLPSPTILSLGAPGLLACRLRCRRNRQGRRVSLLPCGLLLKQALLLMGLTLELLLVLA